MRWGSPGYFLGFRWLALPSKVASRSFWGSFEFEGGWWELQVSAEKLDGAEAHYVDRSLMGPNHSFSLMPSPAKHTQYVAVFLPPNLHFAFSLHFVCMSWQFEMFVFYGDRYPYVTGTSVLGIKYKDGILLASDTAGVALLTACLQPANENNYPRQRKHHWMY